jgi:hypothetical protein
LQKNSAKKMTLFAEATVRFCKKNDKNIGLWEKRHLFRRKLAKIVITTSTPAAVQLYRSSAFVSTSTTSDKHWSAISSDTLRRSWKTWGQGKSVKNIFGL